MGACCENVSGTRKFKVKVKRKKKRKNKDKIEDMNFEIIDTNQNKSHQILTKSTTTLRELLTMANFNLTEDFEVNLKNNKNINEEFNTNLKDIIDKYYPDVTLITLTILVNNKGLSIPSNIKKAYMEMSPLIGSAIFDEENIFSLLIYCREKSNLQTFYLDKKKNENIKNFNNYSAFCSAKGFFYISGGERSNEVSPEDIEENEPEFFFFFLSIDMNQLIKNPNINLNNDNNDNNNVIKEDEKENESKSESNNKENNSNTLIKKLPRLNIERSWHSMIFIPNKYIFIVGGIYTKIVEKYDIEKNEIKIDSELKEKRCEPTLCLANNNYLYAFCGFHPFKDFNNNIERCDLLKKKRQWEIIGLSSNITASFFGISFYKDNDILLISSKDNVDEDNKNYTVKIGNDEDTPDEIKETVLQYNGVRTFKDKLFYPMFDNFCVNIPMNIGNNKNVLILETNTGEIECKHYK